MEPLSCLVLLMVGSARVTRALSAFVSGLFLAAAFNLPWVAAALRLEGLAHNPLVALIAQPAVTVAANAVAGALIVWGLYQLLLTATPEQRLVRTLVARGDFRGAAEIQFKEGKLKAALALFRKARAWQDAARVALRLGNEHEAAELLRRAGGHNLAEASRLLRRSGDIAAALRCDRDLAEWLTSRGRYDEAVEVWLRAGEPQRAAGAALIALEEGRLSASHPSLPAARRAVEHKGDHRALARLYEIEGNWQAAALAWRKAGEHGRGLNLPGRDADRRPRCAPRAAPCR